MAHILLVEDDSDIMRINSSFLKKDNSTAGLKAIAGISFSSALSTIVRSFGIKLVNLIYLWICLALSPNSSANIVSLLTTVPSGRTSVFTWVAVVFL